MKQHLHTMHLSLFMVFYAILCGKTSVTAGVISRVEMQGIYLFWHLVPSTVADTIHTYIEYSHSLTNLLTIQIDAAINSGNSGGPAFHKGSFEIPFIL